ncbi:hypothetical protein SteCoe_22069 [Stentor coeruleus]|uniref:Uncharacterized protein n=1 Tax=Stentor coeruleus TaxID=5963 RepID=A0A1R2BN22_9CILI|nr:hypothetical protein SteCoe_22069 [Stentor coeruleus]
MQRLLTNKIKSSNLLLPKLEMSSPCRIKTKNGPKTVKSIKKLAYAKSTKNTNEPKPTLTKRNKQSYPRLKLQLSLDKLEKNPQLSPRFLSEKRSLRIRKVSILDMAPIE